MLFMGKLSLPDSGNFLEFHTPQLKIQKPENEKLDANETLNKLQLYFKG